MTTKRVLENQPNSDEIWSGIGGHFDTLGQIIAEFVDNAFGNITATEPLTRTISVRLQELNGNVRVQIEDTGCGIDDLDNAFTLGGRADRQSPLNEHGFGMKHALASANPSNNAWAVYTRTQQHVADGVYERIQSPYIFDGQVVTTVPITELPWPGLFNGPGTLVDFECSREMFETLGAGIPGRAQFEAQVGYLVEFLGYTYSGLIQAGAAVVHVSWQALGAASKTSPVAAVRPNWAQYIQPPGCGEVDHDLGNGLVKLRYEFGQITDSNYKRYYRTNTRCSGLEIRQNGRLIANNIFFDVWNREPHNMYNSFLVVIDVESDDPGKLPPTRTSKNGYRQGDERLAKIYEWVRHRLPDPPREIGNADSEADLFNLLRDRIQTYAQEPKTVKREQPLFTSVGETRVRADLYYAYGNEVILYEGKKDITAVKDAYQLRMYWDGAVKDGIQPTQGKLIAANHPQSVLDIIDVLNTMVDANGKLYNFLAVSWQEEGIDYPTGNGN